MSFLSRLFGGSGNNEPERIGEPMNEDAYWKIIAESLKNSSEQGVQHEFILDRLKKLSSKDIIGFKLRTDKLMHNSYNDRLWCAAYIINGGCSDDGFDYFRYWLIARGKKIYYDALANPDSLALLVEAYDEFEFEDFGYVANDAFEEKTENDIDDYIDENVNVGYPEIEFTWQEENRESMKAVCPQLFNKMWDK